MRILHNREKLLETRLSRLSFMPLGHGPVAARGRRNATRQAMSGNDLFRYDFRMLVT
jgi:hypothetical protein